MQQGADLIVSVVFRNLTDHHIKQLEFTTVDSLNTRLIRAVSDARACVTMTSSLATPIYMYTDFFLAKRHYWLLQ